jgi:GrpB-like predicted nucleotidyltransferase (UPF0157 family)
METLRLKIELEDFLSALTFGLDGLDGGWYLDRDTGDILLAADGAPNLPEDVEDNPRYMRIGRPDSRTSFRVMEDFADRLDQPRAVERLRSALRGRKPFRAFKDALYDFPDLQTAWHTFERAAHRRHADDWCEAHDIGVEWT